MALATANGFNIIEATVTLPRTGRWIAELVVDAETATQLSGELTLQLGSKLTLQGTIKRSGDFLQKVKLQAVGGAAGLLKVLQPKAYQGVPLRVPLGDALAEVGEALSSTADETVLDVELPKWNRLAIELGEEIRGLLQASATGATGRILPDGSFWVGVETWPAQDIGAYNIIEDHRGQGEVLVGIEEPQLLPGTTFLGRRVQEVTYTITGGSVRMHVQFVQDGIGREPDPTTPAADLDYVVQKQLKRARYMRAFPAKVVQQNGDLSLELELDSPDVPGLSNVPLRAFAPGSVVKVQAGSRVAVIFEDGDPQKPVAVQWEQGAGGLNELEVHTGAKASLVSPDVRLGSTGASEQLVLGNQNATLEGNYDSAVEQACTTLTGAISAAAAAPGWPTPAQLAALWTGPMTSFANAVLAAAQARSYGRSSTLSGTSKTD